MYRNVLLIPGYMVCTSFIYVLLTLLGVSLFFFFLQKMYNHEVSKKDFIHWTIELYIKYDSVRISHFHIQLKAHCITVLFGV